MNFKTWLEQDQIPNGTPQMPPPNNISMNVPDQTQKYKQTIPTDTLLAVDQEVERLQQTITNLIFRKKFENTDQLENNWGNFLKSWREMKQTTSTQPIAQPGLGSYMVSPGQEAMLRNQQPPATPNTSGWSASGGLNV